MDECVLVCVAVKSRMTFVQKMCQNVISQTVITFNKHIHAPRGKIPQQ